MESVCLRFPHLFEEINRIVDDKTLVNCRESSRILCETIDNQKVGSHEYFEFRIRACKRMSFDNISVVVMK